MSRFAPSLLLLLCLTVTSARAQERRPVAVAARPLAAGTVVTQEMLAQRLLPASLVTPSLVAPGSTAYLLRQRLLEPLAAGEPLQWSQFATTASRPENLQPYCQAVKEAQPRQRAYPEAPGEKQPRTVLVAVKGLPRGTVLKRDMLATRVLPPEFVSPYVVLEDGANAVEGQRLLVPVEAGDLLRYPQLAVYASEPRCDWLFEEGGNVYEKQGPAEARALQCPAGTTKREGVPAGAKWTPTLPGWMARCEKRDGTAHGPVRAWHRLGKGLLVEGQYDAGKRTGRWRHFCDTEALPLRAEANYVDGRLHGPFTDWSLQGEKLAEGLFQHGLREGPWKFTSPEDGDVLHLSFSGGLLQGSSKRVRADGSVVGERVFEKGVPSGGPQPEDTPVLVAARALPEGTVMQPELLATRPLPASLVVPAFIKEEHRELLKGQALKLALPAGAPLLWWDFDLPPELPAPGPPRGGGTPRK